MLEDVATTQNSTAFVLRKTMVNGLYGINQEYKRTCNHMVSRYRSEFLMCNMTGIIFNSFDYKNIFLYQKEPIVLFDIARDDDLSQTLGYS